MNIEELYEWFQELRLSEQEIYRQSLQDKQRKIECLEEELCRLHKEIERNILTTEHQRGNGGSFGR